MTGNGRAWDSVPPVGVAARPAEAGLYLLLIQAFWVGGRDASYAFYVQVL